MSGLGDEIPLRIAGCIFVEFDKFRGGCKGRRFVTHGVLELDPIMIL